MTGSGCARVSARCHMLQRAGRKHVYVESGDARLLMRYAPRWGRGRKTRHTVLYYGTIMGLGCCSAAVSPENVNEWILKEFWSLFAAARVTGFLSSPTRLQNLMVLEQLMVNCKYQCSLMRIQIISFSYGSECRQYKNMMSKLFSPWTCEMNHNLAPQKACSNASACLCQWYIWWLISKNLRLPNFRGGVGTDLLLFNCPVNKKGRWFTHAAEERTLLPGAPCGVFW